ncbi:hypothetical protein, partial [Ornithinibacillus halophilus]|uniref:hypothetical protein n=1 Tax=Ornithinibacillus halophilus TaxID=930117 RepID=UPI001F33A323
SVNSKNMIVKVDKCNDRGMRIHYEAKNSSFLVNNGTRIHRSRSEKQSGESEPLIVFHFKGLLV